MSKKQRKTTVLRIVADLEIENEVIYEKENLEKHLIDSVIKVKSGLYENTAIGWITDVKIVKEVSENSEETN